MHYLGKEQRFIKGKCGLLGAVSLVLAQAASGRESWEVAMILV
jgi:hypothetical protein